MGRVYRVRHRALGKLFALKVMRDELASDRIVAARFVQEARAMAALDHPNIVAITDFGELDGGVPYFVMELLEGESLASLLRREGAIDARRALGIVRQIASALTVAHAAGIVHRDLKPDNVHVGPGDSVKILDFGIAKVLGSSRLTRTGMIFGTPHYLSPEQASGGPVDHRADLYSLGVLLYELLAGRVPFEADSFMGVLTQHLYTEPVPPSRLRSSDETLGALEPIVLRCLQKSPDARFPSAAELIAALDAIDREDLSTAPHRPAGPSPKYVAIAAGVVAIAAVILVLALARSKPSRSPSVEARSATPPVPVSTASAASLPALTTPPVPPPPSAEAPPPSSPSNPSKRLRPAPSPKPSKTPPSEPASLRANEIIDPWAD